MAEPASRLASLRQLSVAERLQLVEDLWDSIAQDAPDEAMPLTPELKAELDRRQAEYDKDPSTARTWDEVRAGITDRLRRRSAP